MRLGGKGLPPERWLRAALMSAAALTTSACVTASAPSGFPAEDYAAARSLVRMHGGALWEDWAQDDLALLYVDATGETLLCAAPQSGFVSVGLEPVSGCSRQFRAVQNPNDIAAISEIDGTSFAAIGSPEALGAEGVWWRLTVAHEMFHAWQDRQPGYRNALERVRARLAPPGAQDASWMLDYDWPYAAPETAAALAPMAAAAIAYLEADTYAAKREAIVAYNAARQAAESAFSADDWLYFEFQAGQEGVARWTELALAEQAALNNPAYAEAASELRGGVATSLRAIDQQGINLWRRNVFYVYGAIEADMLSFLTPTWRHGYPARPFSLGDILDEKLNPR